MYSIRIVDLKNEGQVLWKFWWKSAGKRNLVNMHMYAQIDTFMSSRFFLQYVIVHFVKDERTHALRTDVHTARYGNTFSTPLKRCKKKSGEGALHVRISDLN